MVIARIIADRADLSARAERVAMTLQDQGRSCEVRRGAEPDLVDFLCEPAAAAALRAALDDYFPCCDALISACEPTVPRVFVSDMDSTMISAECIDELADFAGLKPQIAAITESAMRGELDFAQALTERVRLLAGLGEDAIAACLTQRIAPMPGAGTLVATLKARGCRTVLVTGGFHQFADPVAAQLGFDHVVANTLETAQGKLSGALCGELVDSAVKRRVLEEEVTTRGGPSLATGDGANDIPMIEAADWGVAYHAKPKARQAANGWIDEGDLTNVLRLLGIPRGQWVEG